MIGLTVSLISQDSLGLEVRLKLNAAVSPKVPRRKGAWTLPKV